MAANLRATRLLRSYDFGKSQTNQERFQTAPVNISTSNSAKQSWNPADLPEDAVNYLWMMRDNNFIPHRWCWVQHKRFAHGKSALWVWDACQEPPTSANPLLDKDRYLLAFCVKENDQWSAKRPSRPSQGVAAACPIARRIPAQSDQPSTAQLRPALISSFATEGIDAAAQNWDSDVGCELYLLMKEDLKRIAINGPSRKREFNAVAIMARLAEDTGKINEFAEKLISTKLPLVAFASFVPEITADPTQDRGRRAQGALRFLGRLAIALRERQTNVNVLKVIEVVAGSRIKGIFRAEPLPAGDGKAFQYLSYKMSDRNARENIMANLRKAFDYGLYSQLRTHDISLALELEPGPLFALRDWITLRDMALAIEHDSMLAPITGFNLDIAHWRIAGGNEMLDKLRSDELIRGRITHAHLSGHHPRAHFGDIHIKHLNDPDNDFMPWIRMLREIERGRGGNCPSFSGYVSHEFEAARNRKEVWSSVTVLRDLLVSP